MRKRLAVWRRLWAAIVAAAMLAGLAPIYAADGTSSAPVVFDDRVEPITLADQSDGSNNNKGVDGEFTAEQMKVSGSIPSDGKFVLKYRADSANSVAVVLRDSSWSWNEIQPDTDSIALGADDLYTATYTYSNWSSTCAMDISTLKYLALKNQGSGEVNVEGLYWSYPDSGKDKFIKIFGPEILNQWENRGPVDFSGSNITADGHFALTYRAGGAAAPQLVLRKNGVSGDLNWKGVGLDANNGDTDTAGPDGCYVAVFSRETVAAAWTAAGGTNLSEIDAIGVTNTATSPIAPLKLEWVDEGGGSNPPAAGDYHDATWTTTDFGGKAALNNGENTENVMGGFQIGKIQTGGYFQLEYTADSGPVELQFNLRDTSWGWHGVSPAANQLATLPDGSRAYAATFTYADMKTAWGGENWQDVMDFLIKNNGSGAVTLTRLSWFGELKADEVVPAEDYRDAAWTATDFGGKAALANGEYTENIMGDLPIDRTQAGGYFQLEFTAAQSGANLQLNLLDGWKGVSKNAVSSGGGSYFVKVTYEELLSAWGQENLSGVKGLNVKNMQEPSVTLTRLSWFGALKAEEVVPAEDYRDAAWTTTDFGGKAALDGGANTESVMGDFQIGKIQPGGYFQLEYTADRPTDLQLNLLRGYDWNGVPAAANRLSAVTDSARAYTATFTYEDMKTAWGGENWRDVTGLLFKNNGSNPVTLTRLSWFGSLNIVSSETAGEWEFTGGDTGGWHYEDWSGGHSTGNAIGAVGGVLLARVDMREDSWCTSTFVRNGNAAIARGSILCADVYIERAAFEKAAGTMSVYFGAGGGSGKCEGGVQIANLRRSVVALGGTEYYKIPLNLSISGGGETFTQVDIQLVVQNGTFQGRWGFADVSIQKNGGAIFAVIPKEDRIEDDLYFKLKDDNSTIPGASGKPVIDFTQTGAGAVTKVKTKAFKSDSGGGRIFPSGVSLDFSLQRGGVNSWTSGSIRVTVHIQPSSGPELTHEIELKLENFTRAARQRKMAGAGADGGGKLEDKETDTVGTWTATPGEDGQTANVHIDYERFGLEDVKTVYLELEKGGADNGTCDFKDSLYLAGLTLNNGTVEPTKAPRQFSMGEQGVFPDIDQVPYTWRFGERNLDGWNYGTGWENNYSGASRTTLRAVGNMLEVNVDFSADKAQSWSQFALTLRSERGCMLWLKTANRFSVDLIYDPEKMDGELKLKLFSNDGINEEAVVDESSRREVQIGGKTYESVRMAFHFNRITREWLRDLALIFVGSDLSYQGPIYLANMTADADGPDPYVDATVEAKTETRLVGGTAALRVNGTAQPYAGAVRLADPEAGAETVALYQYLKAVGESGAALFGHMEDTVLKAGSSSLSCSDTMDLTGSLAAVNGLDCGGLFSGFADKYKARHPKDAVSLPTGVEGDVKAAALLSNEAIAEGAIMTLSMHMPNFAYAELVNPKAAKTYARYRYPVDSYTLTGDCMNNILPGGKFNNAFNAYLDLVADYAAQVDGPILFRPLHENTGSWFWWGKAFCHAETYRAVYRYTVEYLRDEKDVHNLLYVYGPGSEAATLEDYAERYPGDEFVDMVGFDTYDDATSPEFTAGFMASFENTVKLTDTFAKRHGKLFAVTETGINSLQNKSAEQIDPEWYQTVMDIITRPEYDCAYYMVWSNYSDDGFYTPYAVSKVKGVLNGHWLMDPFIRFYNNQKSIFAGDQEAARRVQPVKPAVAGWGLTGYLTAPTGGSRVLAATMVTARLSQENVEAVLAVANETEEIRLPTTVDGKTVSAPLTANILERLGVSAEGKIRLYAGETVLSETDVIFNIPEPKQNPLVVDNFESYMGSDSLLAGAWATNTAAGSSVTLTLSDRAQSGTAMKFAYSEPSGGWGGATVSKEADWSGCNALQLWTVPDGKKQKTVVQINAGGKTYETYLNLYDEYNAMAGQGVLVTIPFSEIVESNSDVKSFVENSGKITGFGLWVNAIDNEAMQGGSVSGELIYDNIRAVRSTADKVTIVPSTQRFTDVPAWEWFSAPVEEAADQGLMEGVSAGRFGPRAKLTRAMLAQVLYNLEGRPAAGESGFRDVAGDKWYAPAVAWAKETGVVDGLGDGLFGPDISVSREQAVSILYRYAKYKGRELAGADDLKRFSDAARVSKWAEEAVKWAVSASLLKGIDGRIEPQGGTTRAQSAALLTRFTGELD